MTIREATPGDISQIQVVRNSVTENTLSNPALVTDDDCKEFITVRGKGWVCVVNGHVVGFSIVDTREHNIWALFVAPAHEKKGIGRRLHDTMLDWYFSQSKTTVWLGTAPGTRAETFYRAAGWREAGMHGLQEVKFEMTWEQWKQQRALSYSNH
ncbi:MAG TPA: GNAT family N-acetyltransferase [Flavisolibacter sp.]|nr:GNAT family N-acetyltransferase [Flavisolibacter sp.]